MSSAKDTFEPNTFESNTFACGTWRGIGVTPEVAPSSYKFLAVARDTTHTAVARETTHTAVARETTHTASRINRTNR